MEETFLDVKQVTKRLKISRTTLYNLMEEGKIKPIEKPSYLKKPAKLQFRESDVARLESGEGDPANAA